MDKPKVVMHYDEDGNVSYLIAGDVTVLVVDEQVPHDRVYEVLSRTSQDAIDTLLGDSPWGNSNDATQAQLEEDMEHGIKPVKLH